jgi:capsular exopolysaccharide synthesis family protein
MDLRHVLAAFYRWRLVMIVLFVCGVGVGSAYAALAPRSYASSTTLFFSLNRSTSVSTLAQGSTYTQDVVKSYSQIVTKALVLDPVIQQLNLPMTAKELASHISVQLQPDTVLATITVTDSSASRAQAIANDVGVQLGNAVLTLSPGGSTSPAAVRVTTISAAEAPRLPISPNVPLVLVLGVVLGVILAVGAAILLDVLTSPLVDNEAAERDSQILGKIVYDAKAKSRPLPIISHAQSPRAESFRSLRTNLRLLHDVDAPQCLVVTSASPKDGRTSVAVNLAIAVAQSHRRVLLIDADLRHPAVASRLGLVADTGLSDVLADTAQVEDVVRSMSTENWRDSALLDVLPSGLRVPDPSDLLARPMMTDLLDEARKRYDLVIIDTPPLLPVTDAALLAAQSDQTVLVVNARTTNERDFQESLTALRLAGARAHGVVFNQVRVRRRDGPAARLYGLRDTAWRG